MDAPVTFALPVPIAPEHRLDAFDCGAPSLDAWLKRRAFRNQFCRTSRTFVTCEEDRVVGYYSLALGLLATAQPVRRRRGHSFSPIPIVVLGRVAVDRRCQACGLGRALVYDAVTRVAAAAEAIDVVGVVAHAVSAEARQFYLRLGFKHSTDDERSLILPLADLATILGDRP